MKVLVKIDKPDLNSNRHLFYLKFPVLAIAACKDMLPADYVTRRSENWDFEKEKKDFAWHDHEIVHFWPRQKLPRK